MEAFIHSTLSWNRVYMHICIIFAMWLIMIMAVGIDLWDGVHTAKVLKERIKSNKLRLTFNKIGDYWRVVLFGLLFDTIGILFTWYIMPFMSMLLTVVILIIEFRSLMEHAQRRKDNVSNVPDVLAAIIRCKTEKDAKEILTLIEGSYETAYKEGRIPLHVTYDYTPGRHVHGVCRTNEGKSATAEHCGKTARGKKIRPDNTSA